MNWFTPNAWLQTGDPALDWGIVEFGPNALGQYPGDFTGTWGITANIVYNSQTPAPVISIGYPATGWFLTGTGSYNGRQQYTCHSSVDPRDSWTRTGSGYEGWFPCYMNGGASGGPVFVQLANGTWTIGGVNNRCYGPGMGTPKYCDPLSDWLRYSYFGQNFLDFWASVQPYLRPVA